jgi:hypothetical protein
MRLAVIRSAGARAGGEVRLGRFLNVERASTAGARGGPANPDQSSRSEIALGVAQTKCVSGENSADEVVTGHIALLNKGLRLACTCCVAQAPAYKAGTDLARDELHDGFVS